MQDYRGIGRLAIASGRLEVNLLSGLYGVIVKAVAQATDYADDVQVTGCLKNDLEQNFTFNAQVFGFLSIGRNGLGKNFRG